MSDAIAPNDDSYVIRGVNIRILARRQRWMLWLVLAGMSSPILTLSIHKIISYGGTIAFTALAVLMYAVQLTLVVGAVLIMQTLRANVVLVALATLLMLACAVFPLGNILVLMLINGRATRCLREAGLKVGFMGVKDEQVVLKLSRDLCRQCGYNLTGNVSGVCPECGTMIQAARIVQSTLPPGA